MAIEFPQWVIDRVVARQGRLHAYERIDASRTAFVVIDLQNYFMLPGYQGECAASRATIPVVNRLANALRAAGGTVIWVQTSADGADVFWSHHHREMLTPERSRRRLRELASDSPGFALHAQLDARPEDPRVVKRCYSALAPGSSDLAEVLAARGIDTLLIGGTVTNACCESTARDAMMQNFRTVMVDDALSAVTEQEHFQSLCHWILFFGDVLTAAQIEAGMADAQPAAAAIGCASA